MVSIQEADFSLQAEVERLRNDTSGVGAIVSFLGLVRDLDRGDKIESLFLEHYPGMTERSIEAIVGEANQRWNLIGCRVIHRVGELKAADQIVLVVVASSHRDDAFAACRFIIDFLKTRAPIWKKELTNEGGQWVETRASDFSAIEGWNRAPADGRQ